MFFANQKLKKPEEVLSVTTAFKNATHEVDQHIPTGFLPLICIIYNQV